MGSEKAVVVRGGDNAIYEELAAGGVITPGQLLEHNSSLAAIRHNTAGATQYGLIANIDFSLGSRDIDVNYASGEQVQCVNARRGMIINMLLADGESATKGTSFLESNGDGDLKVHAADSEAAPHIDNQIVGVALETLDLSDSSGADPASRRILVQII